MLYLKCNKIYQGQMKSYILRNAKVYRIRNDTNEICDISRLNRKTLF